MTNKVNQGLINHVAFVLDASGSMTGLKADVIRVFDKLVERLARESKDLDQETRVTVYVFGNNVECVIYDKDVLRLPSIAQLYHDGGMTKLLDATYRSQVELAQTAQLYGDHAFLTFVLTDGEENDSKKHTSVDLRNMLATQSSNWTMACLVPDIMCKRNAVNYGFPTDNVMIWDTTRDGLEKAVEKVADSVSGYMVARSTGVRGSNTLFAASVTQAQVDASGMKAIDPDAFMIIPVALASTSTLAYVIPKKSITKKNPNGIKHVEIMPFIQETGRTYVAGQAYYELVKSERFDPQKKVALIHRQTKKVYVGNEAKALIGLTGTSTRVRPQPVRGGDYDIFIQSTSVNRHLPIGSRVLIFK
jgi:uncharacterized protein YegL